MQVELRCSRWPVQIWSVSWVGASRSRPVHPRPKASAQPPIGAERVQNGRRQRDLLNLGCEVRQEAVTQR
jgi:hypothetical protein